MNPFQLEDFLKLLFHSVADASPVLVCAHKWKSILEQLADSLTRSWIIFYPKDASGNEPEYLYFGHFGSYVLWFPRILKSICLLLLWTRNQHQAHDWCVSRSHGGRLTRFRFCIVRCLPPESWNQTQFQYLFFQFNPAPFYFQC